MDVTCKIGMSAISSWPPILKTPFFQVNEKENIDISTKCEKENRKK